MNPIKKVLIGYDGSTHAAHVLEDLEEAGLAPSVEVLLVTVAEVWMPVPEDAGNSADDLLAEATDDRIKYLTPRARAEVEAARDIAHKGSLALRSNFPDWRIETHVYCDSPAPGILHAAERYGADLIVVGSHGRSMLGQLMLGSVSQKVLTEAHCSVRIGRRPTVAAGSGVRIVLAVDGTPDSLKAVGAVASRTWPAGSSVKVITASGEPRLPMSHEINSGSLWGDEDLVADLARSQGIVDEAVNRLRESGMTASGVVHDGTPIPVILEEAESWGADVIFMGARGHSFAARFLLGSVSATVAARAHCSVEIVR